VIDRLARDLRSLFPDMGMSARNLKYMRAFAKAWPDPEVVQGRLAQLSWWHQIALLEKLDDAETRLWYADRASEHGWTRDVLVHQIEGALHLREGKGLTNFDRALPAPQSEMAQQTSRNPYIFGFLGLDEQATEREVERGLMANVERFLLEMGEGFAVVGRQKHLEVGGQDFFIDLLLYQLVLRSADDRPGPMQGRERNRRRVRPSRCQDTDPGLRVPDPAAARAIARGVARRRRDRGGATRTTNARDPRRQR
jgi:predicted nuclease of restriction endonuclease-like (RecB) superfamily